MGCTQERQTDAGQNPATVQDDASVDGVPAGDGAGSTDSAASAPDARSEELADAQVGADAGAGPSEAGAGPPRDSAAMQGESAVTDPGGRAPWLISSGDKVFFIGNSFFGSEANRLSTWVTQLCAAMTPPINIETGELIVYGNQPLSWFFAQPESQQAIESGQYTMFVVQGEDREPVDNNAAFKQAVHDYYDAITAHGGRMMLFMTWDWAWECQSDFLAKLATAYDEVGRELNIPVIPAGLIFDDSNKHPFDGEPPYWLTSQGLHQNDMGAAANAYATFAMLTGINPMGQDVPLYHDNDTPELMKYLSDLAWAEVAPRLAGQIPEHTFVPGPCPPADVDAGQP